MYKTTKPPINQVVIPIVASDYLRLIQSLQNAYRHLTDLVPCKTDNDRAYYNYAKAYLEEARSLLGRYSPY